MFGIIAMFFLVTIVIVLSVVIYYIFYSIRINRKIQNGDTASKRMIDIPKVVMTSIIVLLLLYSIILSTSNKRIQSIHEEQLQNRDNYVQIDLEDYTYSSFSGNIESADASYAKMFSKEENEGYTKTVQTEGNFVFTIFTRNSSHDDFHPDFLCYVDYVGQNIEKYSVYQNREYIDSITEEMLWGNSFGGSFCEDGTLFIGNINDNESFKITFALLDEEAEKTYSEELSIPSDKNKGDTPIFSYAKECESVIISVE